MDVVPELPRLRLVPVDRGARWFAIHGKSLGALASMRDAALAMIRQELGTNDLEVVEDDERPVRKLEDVSRPGRVAKDRRVVNY